MDGKSSVKFNSDRRAVPDGKMVDVRRDPKSTLLKDDSVLVVGGTAETTSCTGREFA